MNFLIIVFSFLLAIVILVGVHEFGHFWVARKLGVKVLTFSIGFGKKLWRTVSANGETEYVLSAIPLGGYVKMLDEREMEVDKSELHRAFNRKPLWVRTAIVAAGPIFNLAFAVLVYWVIFMAGITDLKPVLGYVTDNTKAHVAGLTRGDEILSLNEVKITSWGLFVEKLLSSAVNDEKIYLTVKKPDGDIVSPVFDNKGYDKSPQEWINSLGFKPFRPEIPPVINEVMKNTPAQIAGLRPGDKILTINGKPVTFWEQLTAIIRANPGVKLKFTIAEQNGKIHVVDITPESHVYNGKTIGVIGVSPTIPPLDQSMMVTVRYGPLDSLIAGISKTWNMSAFMLKMLWKMISGQESVRENIGGPISIAKIAGDTLSSGFTSFLIFLALISISLGILNLLPIPVLDGGHLLFYLVEFIKGSPVSGSAENFFQRIGIALIMTLMLFALYVDILRLF